MRHISIMGKKSHFRSQEMSNVSTYQNEQSVKKGLFIFDRAKAHTRAYFGRKLPASVGALLVNRAKTCLRVQKIAVAIRALGQHEKLGSLSVRGDIPVFFESFSHFFYGVRGFIFTCDAQSDQIESSNFNRHRATIRTAICAIECIIFFPG